MQQADEVKREIVSRVDQAPEDKRERIANAYRTIMQCLGEDPDRPGLIKTPYRAADAMLFLTKGYEKSVLGSHIDI